MKRWRRELDIDPSRFFLLRTPLLPFCDVEEWSRGLRAPRVSGDEDKLDRALTHDQRLLRSRLRAIVQEPAIREALFIASPSLVDGLDSWRRDPDSKKGRRAQDSLVRYFLRMASRPTPFGLFSGCSAGAIGSRSRLRLGARDSYQRHTRLDVDYLCSLAASLEQNPALRRTLLYSPNTSLYRAADRIRYVESRQGEKGRVHHLVAVEADEFLTLVLERAAGGATLETLAQILVAADPDGEITIEEAEAYVDELIETQLLISDLCPPVTGPQPIDGLIARLAELPEVTEARRVLEQVDAEFKQLDAEGTGHDLERYLAIGRRLEALPAPVDSARLFHVDLFKPDADVRLGDAVLAEVTRGLAILRRIAPPLKDPLADFREAFLARYQEGQEVPLATALDEEAGVGFKQARELAADAAPLLQNLPFPQSSSIETFAVSDVYRLLSGKLEEAFRAGASEVEITAAELDSLPRGRIPELPDAFQVTAAVAAPSEEALDRGEFRVLLGSTYGPSGARLMGRFCHGDETLRRHSERHLREEEALAPGAVFAEIVHLPEGRAGNVLNRPVMRDFEIPLLGRSGAPEDRQIPIRDLTVSVTGDRVILRSVQLGKRVLPRLTTAHNFRGPSPGIYRFLCFLQSHRRAEILGWSWGPLKDAYSFLPRVACGRLVLARALWRVTGDEIEKLTRGKSTVYRAVQQWRERRRLPRWALFEESDQSLLVDFDNVLSVEAFLSKAKRHRNLELAELFPEPGEFAVSGPEGRFNHQMVIPFVRRKEAPPEIGQRRPQEPIRRTFPPGSEWLYAKLYTGTSSADGVLCDEIVPLAREAMTSGAADHWHFIRYGDPQWHLRLRFHGAPRQLHREVLPALQELAGRLLDSGRIWRLQLDTYEREVERYGGPEGVALAERLFHLDSEAVASIVEQLAGDSGAEARWHLALRGTYLLLCGLRLENRSLLSCLRQLQQAFFEEHSVDRELKQHLAARLRHEAPTLNRLLTVNRRPDHGPAAGFAALERRSRKLEPIVEELYARERAGQLAAPVSALAASFVHMFNNRLFRSHGRAHELVLYDFLYRMSRSRAARERAS